ncbi:MAG: transporter [Planctomycetota bacterium]
MKLFATIVSLSLCLMLAAGDIAYADHPVVSGLGEGQSGPINTTTAMPVIKGRFFADFRTDITKFRRYSDSQLLNFAVEERNVDSTDYTLSLSAGLVYGATEHLTVGFRMPYVRQHDIREGENEDSEAMLKREGNSTGIGDLTLYGLYRFYENKDKDIHIAGILGLSVPTGRTNERTDLGGKFEMEHQPGSGSWDPMGGFAVTKNWGRLSLNSNVLYIYATRGSQRTTLGDTFEYNLALSYRLNKNRPQPEDGHSHSKGHRPGDAHSHEGGWHVDWDLVSELNGVWRQKLRIKGRSDKDSGGTLLYLFPGVRMLVNNRVSVTASFLYPIQDDANGLEHKVDYRAIMGVGVGF